jgi:hypothetical protein
MPRTLLLLAALSSACSVVLVNPPPTIDPGTRPIDCTSDDTWLYGDGVVASLGAAAMFGGLGGLALSDSETIDEPKSTFLIVILVGSVLTGLALGSAEQGWHAIERCKAMNEAPLP